MKTGIPGQLDMFDLLDDDDHPSPRRAASTPTVKQARFVPSPENPVHCVCCGAEITAWFDYDVNHHPMGWHEGQRLCTAMNLTRNHVSYYALQVRGAVTGKFPEWWGEDFSTQCCYSKHDLHGKAVRKPTALQLGDHLRARIERARPRGVPRRIRR